MSMILSILHTFGLFKKCLLLSLRALIYFSMWLCILHTSLLKGLLLATCNSKANWAICCWKVCKYTDICIYLCIVVVIICSIILYVGLWTILNCIFCSPPVCFNTSYNFSFYVSQCSFFCLPHSFCPFYILSSFIYCATYEKKKRKLNKLSFPTNQKPKESYNIYKIIVYMYVSVKYFCIYLYVWATASSPYSFQKSSLLSLFAFWVQF